METPETLILSDVVPSAYIDNLYYLIFIDKDDNFWWGGPVNLPNSLFFKKKIDEEIKIPNFPEHLDISQFQKITWECLQSKARNFLKGWH